MDLRVLVIDPDQGLCEQIQCSLDVQGWSVSWCTSAQDGLELALEQPFDAVLVDANLPDVAGLSLCRRLSEGLPDTPVLVLAENGDLRAVIAALRAGARDFIAKPMDLPGLRVCIERTVRERHWREAVGRLAQAEQGRYRAVGELKGESRAMARLYDLIRRVAPTETTVLLSGESGTGKELVARAVHAESRRAQGPFVAINCAAVPANLLESELFGHVRGAFTDASADRKGLFQQASEGTLFLDEVGELPLELQPKLLRVLQERTLRPVGGNALVRVPARIIAASNHDLEKRVAGGQFREDLYFRLNVVQLCVPPLRVRGNDILLLAGRFSRRAAERLGRNIAGIAEDAAEKLLAYDWPGNVRQLENAMERAVALARGEQIALEDLPERIENFDPASSSALGAELDFDTLSQQERRHIEYVLRRVKGNRTEAARLLGVDRRTLYRKLQRERNPTGG